jgi:hypothetical protein
LPIWDAANALSVIIQSFCDAVERFATLLFWLISTPFLQFMGQKVSPRAQEISFGFSVINDLHAPV